VPRRRVRWLDEVPEEAFHQFEKPKEILASKHWNGQEDPKKKLWAKCLPLLMKWFF